MPRRLPNGRWAQGRILGVGNNYSSGCPGALRSLWLGIACLEFQLATQAVDRYAMCLCVERGRVDMFDLGKEVAIKEQLVHMVRPACNTNANAKVQQLRSITGSSTSLCQPSAVKGGCSRTPSHNLATHSGLLSGLWSPAVVTCRRTGRHMWGDPNRPALRQACMYDMVCLRVPDLQFA